MFYTNNQLIILGGQENTAKNWLTMKENARKSQMETASSLDVYKKKDPAVQSMGFSLSGNKGGASRQQAKNMD
jgi:hypothetical protein